MTHNQRGSRYFFFHCIEAPSKKNNYDFSVGKLLVFLLVYFNTVFISLEDVINYSNYDGHLGSETTLHLHSAPLRYRWSRREIITVRELPYVSRLPKYWPPPPSPPGECVLPPNKGGGTHSPGGEGGGGSIFWKTRDIGFPSYSNNLSTAGAIWRKHRGREKRLRRL